MKDVAWIETKNAANRCFWVMKPRLNGYDVVKNIYNDGLPQILKDIAVHAFLYNPLEFGEDILIVKNALYQLEDKGFIGEGKEA